MYGWVDGLKGHWFDAHIDHYIHSLLTPDSEEGCYKFEAFNEAFRF